ncbi:MAG: Hsp33 family molecular chaperone HslO, partial [Clostridiales bacterium]|nr:Hsp33 family molecular chaperone HslO [Clostridiales bacterium]
MHQMSPAATAALGRFMTGSLLISESMKNEKDTQTTIIRGDGPMEGMTCVADFGFKVRAYPVEPVIPTEYHKPGKINVGAAVGKGSLTVIRDVGLKEPYVGVSELVSGEIAEDFAYYLAKSEQTKSIVSLGVFLEHGEVSAAGGLMIQLLPGAGEDEISYLEKRASGFPEISFLFKEGFTPAQIIDLFMGDPDLVYLDGQEVEFKCNCSRERMLSGLAALGKNDLEEITKDGKPIETVCRFCNSKYVFDPEELKFG